MPGSELPAGINPAGWHTGTIRHVRCERCGHATEVRWRGWVPSSYYNAVVEYVRAAAGDEFVLMPVATLNAMGEELERLRLGRVRRTPTQGAQMESVDERDQSGQQHGDGDNAGGDVVQGNKSVEVVNPTPDSGELPETVPSEPEQGEAPNEPA